MPILSASADVHEAVLRTRAAVGVAWVREIALFGISGPDAGAFLQNRLSNDVLALASGEGHLNAVLDRQGKIEGVFSLHCLEAYRPDSEAESGFFLLADAREAESIRAGIEKYHILERFRLEDRSEATAILLCQGPKAREALSVLGLKSPEMPVGSPNRESPESRRVWADLPEFAWRDVRLAGLPVRIVRRSVTGEDGYFLLVDAAQAAPLWEALRQAALGLDGAELAPDVLEVLRVEAGLPRYGMDYDHDTLLPETGLERLAVSYTKGCYLGQETIARIRTYGSLPRMLTGLLFEPGVTLPSSSAGHGRDMAILAEDGRAIGMLKSAVDSPTLGRPIAIASLGKAERTPGRTLTLLLDDRSYTVTVTLLPFYAPKASCKSGRALLEEGLARFSEGLDAEAVRLLREATQADPALVEAYEALGVILARQDRYEEAIALMEDVLRLDPDHVLAHTNLSVYYMKLGDREKAEAEKAKATMAAFSRKAKEAGLAAVDMTARLEAERQRKERATLEKIDLFREALRFSPDDPLGNFGLGSAYLDLKRFAEAVEPLQKTIRAQPKHSVAYLSLGKALEGLNRFEEARDIYQRGVETAAARGDLMPLQEMQARLAALPPNA
jgi:folate-binding protein YgfZ